MPTSAVHHIQKIAPGPPRKIAVATPAILPVPTVAARQVISAWNGLISPEPSSSFLRPCQSRPKAVTILASGMNFSPSMRNRPVPRMRTSMGGPQTRPLRLFTTVLRNSIRGFSLLLSMGQAMPGVRGL
ncbi:hypothetical protein D3C81_1812570 [compost metagenome]